MYNKIKRCGRVRVHKWLLVGAYENLLILELVSIHCQHFSLPKFLHANIFIVNTKLYTEGLISQAYVYPHKQSLFPIDNFSSFYTKPDPHSTLYLLASLWSTLWFHWRCGIMVKHRPYLLTIGPPSRHLTSRHSMGEGSLTSPHPGDDFIILLRTPIQA